VQFTRRSPTWWSERGCAATSSSQPRGPGSERPATLQDLAGYRIRGNHVLAAQVIENSTFSALALLRGARAALQWRSVFPVIHGTV